MPAPYYYYLYPFGENADDLTSIPTTAAVDGSVSYFAGWTDPYELNLLTNPSALPIPRGQMNQLFFDITNNLQEYQQYGTPQWVTGNTVAYPIYARVYYTGVVYENQVAANTVTPGTDTSWLVISGTGQGVPVGTVLDFAAASLPSGFLLCDGSQISRTTYAALLNTITFTQTGTLTNGANTVSGLSSTANMYGVFNAVPGMAVEGTGIPPGTTILAVVDGTDITLSANATAGGAQSLTFFPWSNGNGTTTFSLPDFRRKVAVGSGGTASTDPLGIGNVVGMFGGQESHVLTTSELTTHSHTVAGANLTQSPPGTQIQGGTNWQQNGTLTTNNTGSNNAFNVIQPALITYKMIKAI